MEEQEERTATALEDEIFGDESISSTESEDQPDAVVNNKMEEEMSEVQEEESEDDNDAAPSDSTEDENEEEELEKEDRNAASDKILEARREFEEALERTKSTGNRRQNAFETGSPVDLDDIAEKFVKRMLKAADEDNDAVEAGKPALSKQKMMAEVLDFLTKKHFHEVLLDNDILMSIRAWLEPLPNRSLPAPNVRKALLEVLKTLPIETVHLRESGLGRIVHFFSQRQGELEDIRRLSTELVTVWSRPIIQRSTSSRNPEHHDNESGNTSRASIVLQSDSLKKGGGRRFVGIGIETPKQKKIVQNLAKKRTKSVKF